MKRLVQRTNLAWVVIGVLTIAGLVVLPSLKASLLPAFKERSIVIQLEGAPGMSQPEMSRISDRVSQELRSMPGIRNVSAQVGRAIFGDRAVNVNSAELWVSIDSSADYDQTVSAVQSIVTGYPGVHGSLQTYLKEASSAAVAGSNQSLVLRVYGTTDAGLRASAQGIQKAIAGIQGVADSHVNYPVYEPTLEIEVNLPAAQLFGVAPGDVRRGAATMFSGLQVGSLFEEQKVFDVVVWSLPEYRKSISDIQNMQVDTPNGGHVRLGDVAQVRLASTPSVIRHDAVKRYFDILVDVQGRSLPAVAADLRSKLRKIQLPLEYHAEVLGDFATQQAASTRVLFIALAALLGIFLLLQATYRSWRLASLAVVTLPMALSGGVLAAFLGSGAVSLGSLAGLLAVLGMVIRNGVVMTDRLYRLEQTGGEDFGAGLILRGAIERISPMVMSALATGLALIPALFLGDIPGLEIIRPMAPVVLGGAITTLVLDLFVFPSLYLRYGLSREADLEIVPSAAAAD